jgi:hypothetical protein
MESFFVRTLGMHRVYNSAFMHMLKNEENDRFRQLLKKTLAFNPQILKRFVNFMNNPDEATAVEQFGKGDKYFGVAVVLATLPGLPMFGHGQVEGFREKYGMEFRRAYWQEEVDEGFVRHHEAQIFPLLHQRYLFSGAEHFALYDFAGHDGINENVLAYSNRQGEKRALVVYHNRAGEAHGWVCRACERVRAEGTPAERPVLSEALALPAGDDLFCRFRDHASGLEYLRSTRELAEQGLFLKLDSYQYHVFLDFAVLHDDDGGWRRLWQELDGRPTADLDRARRRLLHGELLASLDEVLVAGPADPQPHLPHKELLSRYEIFLRQLQKALGLSDAVASPVDRLVAELDLWPEVWSCLGQPPAARMAMLLWGYLMLHGIGELEETPDPGGRAADWLDRFLLDERLAAWLPAATAREDVALLRLLLRHQGGGCLEQAGWLEALLDHEAVRVYLQVHRYHGREWFVRERLEELLTAFCLAGALDGALTLQENSQQLADHLRRCREQRAAWSKLAAQAGYRLDNFHRLLQNPV